MPGSILGNAVHRTEDPRHLRGVAEYVDDLDVPGALHAHFVRSPFAHAVLGPVDTASAAAAPGVVGVFTADDLDLPTTGSRRQPALARHRLASGRVRYVGEPVVVILAESRQAAVDAAELVEVDYDPQPAVVGALAALDGGDLLFPEHGSNVVMDLGSGSGDALDGADVVARGRFVNNRVAPVPLEPNGCLAVPEADRLVVWASCQAPHGVRKEVAGALGLDEEAVRVVAPAVGGGFGAKGSTYNEAVVTCALARRLGRPVRWFESRSENLVAMNHGRSQLQDVALGARSDGTLVGLEARVLLDAGAYGGGFLAAVTRTMASGCYVIPRIDVHPLAVATSTTPVGAYRGAGRPEAAAMVERAMDLLAAELGVDPAELRRRNFIRPEQFPYATPTGVIYDSGDYERALDEALRLADYDGVRAEQARRRAAGETPWLGVGMSCYVEISGFGGEYGCVRVEDDGSVTVLTGSSPHGQGHETAWAQIASSQLGVPFESVRVLHSDTDLVARGGGTMGSRSLQLAGSAVLQSSEKVLDKARRLAAHLLEAAPEDIVSFDDGSLGVAGAPARGLGWAELAVAAREPGLPAELELGDGLAAEADFDQQGGTFPFGAHVAVVEVDPETGSVDLLRMVAVDDCGQVVNPLLADGQIHGGLAQGIAQALFEEFVYDDDGNPLTSSLTEYMFPSAADLPDFETGRTETPSPRNPLGAKGIGESGTTGSTPAVQNAVIDALAHLGVRHLDMPLSPERVWRAIQEASSTPA